MNEQTVKVIEIEKLTPRIKRLRLVNTEREKLAAFSPGSYVGSRNTLETKSTEEFLFFV